MRKTFVRRFILRWFVCGLGLWIAAALLNGRISFDGNYVTVVLAGFFLALINTFIKPLVILLSLPAVLLSLGLFIIVINGFLIYLTGVVYKPLEVTSFGTAMLAGVIIGVVNYLVTAIVEDI